MGEGGESREHSSRDGEGGGGQKLSSVFVMFPEHCSVTQSARGELVDVVCDVPQRLSWFGLDLVS